MAFLHYDFLICDLQFARSECDFHVINTNLTGILQRLFSPAELSPSPSNRTRARTFFHPEKSHRRRAFSHHHRSRSTGMVSGRHQTWFAPSAPLKLGPFQTGSETVKFQRATVTCALPETCGRIFWPLLGPELQFLEFGAAG
ncbi:hypothetical protein Zmor_013281 [Zophobas morio]|uniref:Uncharacterized protein n=1 Tax=Zophobas morio TaxID=2755281 RepID=A0AA38MF12_9CUCU|nr:hypothetical protein Zmor_013281 [Zophobas morio]